MLCWLCGSSSQAGGRREALARREVIPEEGFASWSDPSPPRCRFRAMAPTQTPLRLRLTSASAVPHRALLGFPASWRVRTVHFPSFLAGCRALRPIPCKGSISCKENGEVHVKSPSERVFRRALRLFYCRSACTSLDFLHEFALMQEFGGSARRHARKTGKCRPSAPRRIGGRGGFFGLEVEGLGIAEGHISQSRRNLIC